MTPDDGSVGCVNIMCPCPLWVPFGVEAGDILIGDAEYGDADGVVAADPAIAFPKAIILLSIEAASDALNCNPFKDGNDNDR